MAAVILWLTTLDKARRLTEGFRMEHQAQSLPALAAEAETFIAQPLAAARICRGVMRMLDGMGFAALQEFPLRVRRRADVIALHGSGEIVIVEVKSGRADFQSDRKWPEYLEFCDRFFFAVEPDFPQAILPVDCGLIVADAPGGAILRPAPQGKLNGNRRRVLTLEIAMAASRRLARVLDPQA
jgi:hypothetical protein